MIQILIVDDHAILRRGLQEILEREFRDVRIGGAGTAEEALTQLDSEKWDLVILDITMPGRSGVDVLRTLKAWRPKLPVLVLSMHPEDQYGKRVLRAGASGYMKKERAPEELIKAVRKLLSGGRYVSPTLAETLAGDLGRDDGTPAHERLSDREFEVLRKMASGKTVGQIAQELHLSVPTVSTYRARILEKMGMSNTAELIRYALSHHLV
ncbi:MAG: two-component system, NarL family, invasion response regulator UvrY [Rhodospirillaceae bacterium]|nr:two-component system, NarL family, invasion response regulator UvrY [Rhodospirillaceae bacterium]